MRANMFSFYSPDRGPGSRPPEKLMDTRLALLAATILPLAAEAGVVTMKNGDRITGTVKRIWDGDVFIEPDYADEFSVDQSAVASIEDDRPFEIEYADGTSVTAGLVGMDAEGNQLVSVRGNVIAIPMSQLAELEEPEEFFDWSANADVNTAINKGNTDSQDVNINGDLYLKYNRQRHFLDLQLSREEQDGVTTRDRDLYHYNFNYEIVDPWYFGAVGSYEKDPIKGLDNRYNLVPGIGYEIWNDANRLLIFQAGVGFQSEKTTTSSESGSVYAFTLRFEYDFAKPDLTVFANNTTTKANFGRKNTVTQFSTGVRYEITDLLYANFQFDYDYESEPEGDADNEDVTLLFGLGVEFDK